MDVDATHAASAGLPSNTPHEAGILSPAQPNLRNVVQRIVWAPRALVDNQLKVYDHPQRVTCPLFAIAVETACTRLAIF